MGKSKLTMDDLKNRFDGPMWRDQFEEGSELNKLLKSLPGTVNGEIDVNSILILGLLWCSGSHYDKGEALFELINPKGQNQESISANDKEWDLILDTLVYLATNFTYTNARTMLGESVMVDY